VALSSADGFLEYQLVAEQRGAYLGLILQQHVPSLLNPPGTDVITQLAGVAVTAPYYDENMPAPGQQPRVNTIAGALEIQEYFERVEWLDANNAAGAFMEYVKTKPRCRPGTHAVPKAPATPLLLLAGALVCATILCTS
jgi:hypothetical protein